MGLPQRWLTLAVVSVALLLIVIDMTVLYTALPTLAQALSVDASEKLWILNAYSLVMAGLMPLMGAVGDRIGHRKILLIGMCIFGVASAIAAFAPTPDVLIAARVLLAIGGAAMMPATIAIVRASFEDPKEFAVAIGVWASVASGGAAIGPLVGGFLLEHFWWGSVFLINVPIIVVTLIYIVWSLPKRPGNSAISIDFFSAVLSMLGIVSLVYGIKEFAKPDAEIAVALMMSLLGMVTLTVFVRRQLNIANPLLDFRILREPTIAVGLLVALIASVTLIGFELVLSQRLQLVLEKTPLEAGLYILPISLSSFLAGPLAGFLIGYVGTVRMLILGLCLTVVGVLGYYLAPIDSFWFAIISLALCGMGIGSSLTSSSTLVMSNVSEDRAGMVGSVEGVSYEFGGGLGVTIFGSIMMAVYVSYMQASPFELGYGTSLDEAHVYVQQHPQMLAMLESAKTAFEYSFAWVCGAATAILAALIVFLLSIRKKLMQATQI